MIEVSPFYWAHVALLVLLVISMISWSVLNRRRSAKGETAGLADVSWGEHLLRFLIAFLGISSIAGLLLLQTGWLFDLFSGSGALSEKLLDGESFVGLIGVWIGAPVGFASALYAIYMAHAALQLAKGQNKISESQLELDRTVNDPDRPLFTDGINCLLDLDSAAMALVSMGHLQLREIGGTASERDALRAQLSLVLVSTNSQAMLRFVNRLPERREILERVGKLRFALFRANDVNQRMPLRSDSGWGPQRARWALEMADALSLVRREAICVVAIVRRACHQFPPLAALPSVQVAASEARLAEEALLDQLVDGRSHAPTKVVPARGVVELVDDGRSKEELLAKLTQGMSRVSIPAEPVRSTQDGIRVWEESVRDFVVGANQYCVFEGFGEFWRILYNEARRGENGRVSGLGEGTIIIIDTPYGAEFESPEVKAARDVQFELQAAKDGAVKLSGVDYREPARIWEIAQQLSKLPAQSELMRRLLSSSRSVAISAGVPKRAEAEDDIGAWDDVRQLIELQERMASTPVEGLLRLADEHYDLGNLDMGRFVWLCLSSESELQRDGAGEWWFDRFGSERYLWVNTAVGSVLHRVENRNGV